MTADLRALLVAALGGEAKIVETHASVVALGAERVLKAKKPVRFAFLDLTTRERRAEVCRREVELNRRLAPDVYPGVVDLRDESGRVVDHAVEMRRMPDGRRLAALAPRDATRCAEAVAERLVAFHAAARRGPVIDAAADVDAVRALWEAGFAETAPFVGGVLPEHDAARVAHLARRYLDGRARLFAARVAAGRACDGHGDLLADDVFCLDDGPRVLDCLEFDDHLRFGDVVADVAFLAMDLERLGLAGAARAFVDRYLAASGDRWPRSYEHHWIAYRAHVRAKVAALAGPRARSGEVPADLLALAGRHLDAGRVRLVVVGGAPGTGKSTVAAGLAPGAGWVVLRSDVVRKRLAGLAPEADASAAPGTGLYAPAWTERTYRALLDEASGHLGLGASVVVDASFADARWRAEARAVAAATASDLVELRCTAPDEVAAARVSARRARERDASDATPEIAAAMRARSDSWPEATVLDTTRPVADVVGLARAAAGVG
jgi:aminoglycoside phosphotransferase family enzyme